MFLQALSKSVGINGRKGERGGEKRWCPAEIFTPLYVVNVVIFKMRKL